MDSYDSPLRVPYSSSLRVPYSSPYNPFPHSLLSTRELGVEGFEGLRV